MPRSSLRISVFFSAILLLVSGSAYSQNNPRRIRGTVKDSATRETLENATVSLLRLPDTVLIARTRSSRTGFSFRQQAGNYLLTTSFIGYKTDTRKISIATSDSIVSLGAVMMMKSNRNLAEVVIRTVVPPVISKNDTLLYNAGSFKTRPNATVEELIKKLPGVQVDKEGNVTIQGQKVEKIFVEGKEFFLNDPKLATQNLLADMVDKIEVFDDKSDMARSTGISDPDAGKVLNLRLKPGKKKGLIGTAYASYGNRDRYAVGASVNYFKNSSYLFGIINSNNAAGLFDVNSLRNLGQIAPGDNRSHNGALNYHLDLGKKITLTSSVNINSNQFSNEQINKRQTFLADSSLIQGTQSINSNDQNRQQLNLNLVYTPNSSSILRFNGTVALQQSVNSSMSTLSTTVVKGSSYILNDGVTDNASNSKTLNSNYQLSYGKRFSKRGRYLQLVIAQGYNNNETDGDLYTITRFAADSIVRDQLSQQDASGNNYSVKLFYAEPLGVGKYFDFGYSLSNNYNSSDRYTYNYDPVSGKHDALDSTATNAFNNKNLVQQWSIGYNYVKKKIRYQLGTSLQQTLQKSDDITGHRGDIDQRSMNFFPRANFMYSISRSKNIRLSYKGSSRQPSIEQLQPLPDYTNPLLIRLGNPDLKQEFTHNLNAGLSLFNTKKFRSIFLQLGYTSTVNRIVNATVLNPQGIQEQQYVNVDGNYNLTGNISYGFPLGNEGNGNGKLDSRLQYGHDISLLNGEENIRTSFSWSQQAQLNYNVEEKFYAELSASIMLGKTNYSQQSTPATSFVNQLYSAELSYVFPIDLTVASNLNWQVNGKQGSLPGINNTLWNASLSKKIFARKTGEVRLSVFDLLNSNTNITQTLGDNYIETNQGTVLQQFFLFSFIYQFNHLSAGKTKS